MSKDDAKKCQHFQHQHCKPLEATRDSVKGTYFGIVRITEVQQSITEMVAHRLIVSHGEMEAFLLAHCRASKCCLKKKI